VLNTESAVPDQAEELKKRLREDVALIFSNSAYFGLQQKVNSIGQALMIIGLANIKHLLYLESTMPCWAGWLLRNGLFRS